MNAVTPEFFEACFLDIGRLSDLINGTLSMAGFSRLFSWPLGLYYHKGSGQRVARLWWRSSSLALWDPTNFGSWVPVILGTLAINWIINVIKESEIDELSISLSGSRISYLLACHWAELYITSETAINKTMNLIDLNETVKMIKKDRIDAFSSEIMYSWPKTMCLGVISMRWHRPWSREVVPTCLMGWGSWIPIPRWLWEHVSSSHSEESDHCSDTPSLKESRLLKS